jgi:hypothetical protein
VNGTRVTAFTPLGSCFGRGFAGQAGLHVRLTDLRVPLRSNFAAIFVGRWSEVIGYARPTGEPVALGLARIKAELLNDIRSSVETTSLFSAPFSRRTAGG